MQRSVRPKYSSDEHNDDDFLSSSSSSSIMTDIENIDFNKSRLFKIAGIEEADIEREKKIKRNEEIIRKVEIELRKDLAANTWDLHTPEELEKFDIEYIRLKNEMEGNEKVFI
jgi:hypothetical protein